jgi:hypothetical protein
LPFAVPFHPRVGKSIAVTESLARLRLAGLFGDAGDDGDAFPEHPHGHVAGSGRRVGIGVAFRFREQRRFVAGLAARRGADEIVGYDLLDYGGVVTQERAFPMGFELLNARGDVTISSRRGFDRW